MVIADSECPCGHPFGAHGRGAGACRINGCSCQEFLWPDGYPVGERSAHLFEDPAPVAKGKGILSPERLDLIEAIGFAVALVLVGIIIGRSL